jgi:hypothetical protein
MQDVKGCTEETSKIKNKSSPRRERESLGDVKLAGESTSTAEGHNCF